MSTKVISADSHVQISHEAIKAHLASKYHEAYDEAVTEYDRRTFRDSPTGQVNAGHMDVQKTLAQTHTHPAAGRAGHSDAVERLQDMDTDRVDVEVLYCEVSAFRYLYDLKSGAREATRAFNDTLQDFAATDPKRLVLSYQIPIHDIDDAVAEVKRVIGIGAHSLQLPVFPAQLGIRTTTTNGTAVVLGHRGVRPTDLLSYRAERRLGRRRPEGSDAEQSHYGLDERP